LKIGWSVPAGAVVRCGYDSLSGSAAAATDDQVAVVPDEGATGSYGATGAGTTRALIAKGIMVVGGTPGRGPVAVSAGHLERDCDEGAYSLVPETSTGRLAAPRGPLHAQQHRLGELVDVRSRSDQQRGLHDDSGPVLGVGRRPYTEQQRRLFGRASATGLPRSRAAPRPKVNVQRGDGLRSGVQCPWAGR
jgi:hypothetical protein